MGYFENKVKPFIEVHANRMGFDDKVAFEAIQCAFNKVWLYPSFDMSKARCKNEEHLLLIVFIPIQKRRINFSFMNSVFLIINVLSACFWEKEMFSLFLSHSHSWYRSYGHR